MFRDDVWKVSNSMWTVELDACDELRPEDPDAIQPRDWEPGRAIRVVLGGGASRLVPAPVPLPAATRPDRA